MAKLCGIEPMIMEKIKTGDPAFHAFVDPERLEYVNQQKLFHLDIEMTSKCAGSCLFCYAGSDMGCTESMPSEKIYEAIDEVKKLDFRFIIFTGGDPLLRPDWYEIMSYAGEKGFRYWVISSGLLSKRDAKRLVNLNPECISVHITTLNPDLYAKLHTDPSTLERKIQGYRNLLEAGYPPNKVIGILTVTKQSVETFEETFDWFVDEMGAQFVCPVPFKDEGFGKDRKVWEPSLSQLKRVWEYRAQKLGKHWLMLGSSEGGFILCRTLVTLCYDGKVIPCACLRDFPVGSIYEESLTKIIEKNIDLLTFNQPIKGPCSECENNFICNGCRANAYHYTGDIFNSDPKCYLNPEAKELMW